MEDRIRRLSEDIVREGTRLGLTCGCAESCTGGLVCGALTAIPGSSEVVRGGIVSYAIAIKHDVLGVSSSILNDPSLGAVSGECAQQMCEGAARVLSCDVALSVTGIAGPGGAEPGKPVGTVWFGIWARGETKSICHVFDGDRDEVRLQAVEAALMLIREAFMELAGA